MIPDALHNGIMFDYLAFSDFKRAYRRGFWRKLGNWLTGKSNELLPYHQVRKEVPFEGQRYLGRQTILVDKIVGSVGRYRDFDRAFLPTQQETSQRWINIKKAHYEDVELPPIEVYKIDDVYFVKDGNHRVSVAREKKQEFIDAIVTEISVPIPITSETKMDDLVRQREYAQFMSQTGLGINRPNANLRLSTDVAYGRLLEHISTHRWYLGEKQHRDMLLKEAAVSWYDTVYLPLIDIIQAHKLDKKFPHYTLTDLYWWVSEYQWLRREWYQGREDFAENIQLFTEIYSQAELRQVIRTLRQQHWIDKTILEQERADFETYTQIRDIRPDADIVLSLPGKYDKMLHHISAHRWYMGEERGDDVAYAEAVASWYDNAYLPLVKMIREQDVLRYFPDRTEADLYLWLVDHRDDLANVLEVENLLDVVAKAQSANGEPK